MASAPLLPPPRRKLKGDASFATVNIVLLLVFFFMITGTLVETEEMAVTLAKTEELPIDQLPRPLLLLGEGDVFILDGISVSRSGLEQVLADNQLLQAKPVLYILAESDMPANDLMAVVQSPEMAGFTIKLVTLHTRKGVP